MGRNNHEPAPDAIINTRLAATEEPVIHSERWATVTVRESDQGGQDLNGDGDAEDWVVHLIDLHALTAPARFRRGDCNTDGGLDLTDPVANLTYQFLGEFAPPCLDACDFDDNGEIEITDPIGNLMHQFVGGPPPAPPGRDACGVDPTDDDELGCESFPPCEGDN